MISPISEPKRGDASDLLSAVAAFLRPGGTLESSTSSDEFAYEVRPQQLEMGSAVARSVTAPHHLAVEAGTGVGKSFAYLVPLILHAAREDKRVVVATYTISLQEQLFLKDIPFLRKHLGIDFKAVLVKGRQNYVCLRRLARARRFGPDMFKDKAEQELSSVHSWAEVTSDGTLQDMRKQPSGEVWSQVCVEPGNCLWNKCPEYKRCHYVRARSAMQTAHVLVVNHHLLFSDLKLRTAGASFLPDYGALVVDEAHQMEAVASDYLGIRLSEFSFDYWLKRLHSPDSRKGLLEVMRDGKTAHAVSKLQTEVKRLLREIRNWAALEGGVNQRVVTEPLTIQTTAIQMLNSVIGGVNDLAKGIDDPDLYGELHAAAMRGEELRKELGAFLDQSCDDHVYWVGSEGRRKQTVLYSAPVEVAPVLQRMLFEGPAPVVLTSATLGVAGNLRYFCERVGAVNCEALSVGSPFDYARQMRVFIARNMPDPNSPEFEASAGKAIEHFVGKSGGHAFVLFTSDRMMKAVAETVSPFLESMGVTLLVQGTGTPRHVMLEEFKRDKSSVLFGLDSFWMGVDVRGEALGNVIIVRLPFAVPDQPVVKARFDRIRERGGDPFMEYSLPEAVLKFRQGIGRLIRSSTDTGIVAVLDPRIIGKRYGRLFLASIPECPVEIVDI
ncbi:MAG: hypothetical protein KJ626_13265 [Verrucomicrobia bacterium]|nr:hypothetical protein [Verrucomicrobiota bacterium]